MDETSNFNCGGADSIGKGGADPDRESFTVDITSIPIGATITSVAVAVRDGGQPHRSWRHLPDVRADQRDRHGLRSEPHPDGKTLRRVQRDQDPDDRRPGRRQIGDHDARDRGRQDPAGRERHPRRHDHRDGDLQRGARDARRDHERRQRRRRHRRRKRLQYECGQAPRLPVGAVPRRRVPPGTR